MNVQHLKTKYLEYKFVISCKVLDNNGIAFTHYNSNVDCVATSTEKYWYTDAKGLLYIIV